MPRFIIANRLAGHHGSENEGGRTAVLSTLSGLSGTSVQTRGLDTADRIIAVVDASFDEIKIARASASPDLIIEPEVYFRPSRLCPADLFLSESISVPAGGWLSSRSVIVKVTGQGSDLADAALRLYVRYAGVVQHVDGTTDTRGRYEFEVGDAWEVAAVIVRPKGGYWAVIARGEAVERTIDCPALPMNGPFAWWHDVVTPASSRDLARPQGHGVRVGVIDTGCGPHRNLSHVHQVGSFIQGAFSPGAAADVDGHGTHVTGIIAARVNTVGEYAGIASASEVFHAAVFPSRDSATTNGDLAAAIDHMSDRCAVDVLNLSLGGSETSDLVHDAIKAADARGTLCVCAAGNGGGDVDYPAAFPETVAVGALGKAGWAPPGSLSHGCLPHTPGLFGHSNLYAASFSAHGALIDCVSPGVGIVSTAYDRSGMSTLYVEMDGTSMASPVASGALAVLLSRDAAYLQFPRNSRRTQAARSILRRSSHDVGLPNDYQGSGMPRT